MSLQLNDDTAISPNNVVKGLGISDDKLKFHNHLSRVLTQCLDHDTYVIS